MQPTNPTAKGFTGHVAAVAAASGEAAIPKPDAQGFVRPIPWQPTLAGSADVPAQPASAKAPAPGPPTPEQSAALADALHRRREEQAQAEALAKEQRRQLLTEGATLKAAVRAQLMAAEMIADDDDEDELNEQFELIAANTPQTKVIVEDDPTKDVVMQAIADGSAGSASSQPQSSADDAGE